MFGGIMTVLRTVGFLPLLSVFGLGAATIRIDPPSASAPVGGTVQLNVSILDAVDLYAYQFDVAFDAGLLSAAAVTEGTFLASAGGTLFIPGAIDNLAGSVGFIANTLLGPAAGVNGSGTLARITFGANAIGASPITLSNVLLLDSAGNDIAATVENGSVSVLDTVVPEPGSAIFVFAGIAMTLALRRRATPSKLTRVFSK
jgi:general secretion pathway protein D